MEKINDRNFAQLVVGESISFERTLVAADVEAFIKISGDINPLHSDPVYAATTKFGKPIVHGMLLGALCSTLVGVYLPGKHCLYLSQELFFKNPVYIGDTIVVRGTVVHKSQSVKIVELLIEITKKNQVCVSGKARVQLLN